LTHQVPQGDDDCPGRIMRPQLVLEQDWHHRDPRHKRACLECQQAPAMAERPLWGHRQHRQPSIGSPVKLWETFTSAHMSLTTTALLLLLLVTYCPAGAVMKAMTKRTHGHSHIQYQQSPQGDLAPPPYACAQWLLRGTTKVQS
jgi:hypothetical protein